MSNENIPSVQAAPNLRKIYRPYLFFTSGGFNTRQYDYTLIEENIFILDKNNIRDYVTQDQYNPVVVPSLERYQMYSALRGQKIHCNIFETKNAQLIPGVNHSGLYLISNHANNNLLGVNHTSDPCLVAPNNWYLGDGSTSPFNQTQTFPIEMTGNLMIDCKTIRLNGWQSSENAVFQNGVINTVQNINPNHFPDLNFYTKNIVGANLLCTLPNYPLTIFNWSAQSQFTNPTCANSNLGSIHFYIANYPALSVTYNLMPGNFQNNTGQFTNLGAGVYTITATDGTNSTNTVITLNTTTNTDFCCAPNGPSIAQMPNMHILQSPSANSLIASFGSNIISNRLFYVDNIFTIDEDIEFYNCNFWFTPNAQIIISGTHELKLNKCNLQASCDWWGGIVANAPQQKVIVENGTRIKNAYTAINISDDAIIEASNSFFEDNAIACIALSNITYSTYPGFINKNVFSSSNNLPLPYPKTERGILMNDVQEIKIGNLNDANSGNTFSGLQCGIQIGQNSTSGSAHIQLFNNRFNNIHATIAPTPYPAQWLVNNTYLLPWGSAIYANSALNANQIGFNCTLEVGFTNTPTNYTMNDCDRGIVSIGMNTNVSEQKMNDCLLGIMCHAYFNRSYFISNNQVENAHMGIQLFGNQKYCNINTNTVSLSTSVATSFNIMAPVGIKVQQGQISINAPLTYFIEDNYINIKTITGVGIYHAYADMQAETKGNTIHFSTNLTIGSQGHNLRSLIGVWADKCNESNFEDNNTHGFASPTLYNARNSYGMYMDNSPWCRWSCNKVDYTRYGFYVWGNNETKKEKVTYNRMDFNEFPWYFLDGAAAQAGTFGNIGDGGIGGNEPANEYLNVAGIGSLNFNPSLYKVYRNSMIPNLGHTIFTNNSFLDFSESGPQGTGFEYGVINNSNQFSNPCTNFNIGNTNNGGDDGTYEAYMQDVVDDSIAYINYDEVASWMDRYKVYRQLDIDSLLRISDAALESFYNLHAMQNIGKLRDAERAINLLYDSTTTASNLTDRYNAALLANESMLSGEDWEMNEKAINHAHILLSIMPADSLPQNVKDDIGTIAHLCPYVGGNGVLKARTLWMHWQPNALWDDRVLCMPGQNKNQDHSGIDIDSVYMNTIKEMTVNNATTTVINNTIKSESGNTLKDPIQLYPNPASNYVEISYSSKIDGEFVLYNTIGDVILKASLPKEYIKRKIQLNDIASGLYHYEIHFLDGEKQFGKLSILK